MTDLLFDMPERPSLPVAETSTRFGVRRIFCVGRNYAAHAAEMGNEVDREAPWYFTKSGEHLCQSGQVVPYPPGTQDYHNRRPWSLGKDVENAAVVGTIRPGPLDADARIALTVNGDTRQDAPLSDMVWSVAEVIAHLSRYYHLNPGDLIMTGTPAGVGPVVAGDRLVGTIDGLDPVEHALS
ncbi:MAG: fumarylacetoacetate hydrolase family protein [Loktanella sp.]|nr:fumarylacetoacetate hydrolase family protein [Loktanella sp.]